MGENVRVLPIVVGLALALTGCAGSGSERPEDAITERSHRYHEVLESGFAVTPLGLAVPQPAAPAISAALTQQLFTALFITAGNTPIVGPEEIVERIRTAGEEGVETFQEFRMERILRRPLDKEACIRISQLVLHRYALFTWLEESEENGLEDIDRDYTQADFADDVRRAAFRVVKGKIHGEIVDLWEGEGMWVASAAYTSGRLYGDTGESVAELQRARDGGVLDLVGLLWAP